MLIAELYKFLKRKDKYSKLCANRHFIGAILGAANGKKAAPNVFVVWAPPNGAKIVLKIGLGSRTTRELVLEHADKHEDGEKRLERTKRGTTGRSSVGGWDRVNKAARVMTAHGLGKRQNRGSTG